MKMGTKVFLSVRISIFINTILSFLLWIFSMQNFFMLACFKHVRAELTQEFQRHSERITHFSVHFSDENGDKGGD
jgi:hypothetical protein